MKVAIVNHSAAARILKCDSGMTFVIDSFSNEVAHVRDYRYDGGYKSAVAGEYCIWSLSPDMYKVVET